MKYDVVIKFSSVVMQVEANSKTEAYDKVYDTMSPEEQESFTEIEVKEVEVER